GARTVAGTPGPAAGSGGRRTPRGRRGPAPRPGGRRLSQSVSRFRDGTPSSAASPADRPVPCPGGRPRCAARAAARRGPRGRTGDRWRSPGRRYLCLEPAGRHSVMPGGIASLAGTHDALCVLQDPEAESDAVVVDDELHQDAGVEQPEVVVRQPKTCCVGTPEVADVLTGGHIPEPGGEEEPLALGGRIVDEADPLVSLPGLSLPADGGLPRVGRVVAEGLTPLEAGPVRAVSVGGVTALCFEAPGRVLEPGGEGGDLVERDQVRHAVLLLRRC